MDRREIVKLLAFSSAFPLIPGEAYALFRGVHQSLTISTASPIFNVHQEATVTAMAELILPQTDTPGAKAVHVSEFIDKIVADWYSDDQRVLFMKGLADVDAQTQALFGRDFVGASAIQQAQILEALGDEMAQEASTLIASPPGYRGSAPEPDDNFYFMFRGLTLTGYFTSEAGFSKQLHEEIFPGRFNGCTPLTVANPNKGS